MFKNKEDQKVYIIENYPEITDSRIDENHWDLYCPTCKKMMGFQVIEMSSCGTTNTMYATYQIDNESPQSIYFRCPVCKSYKQWVIYILSLSEERDGKNYRVTKHYRVASLPSEGIEDIEEIPDDPPELRVAYKQAIRAMDANANIAAAAMFRRALQIITRNILKATPSNLANELKQVVGKKFNGMTITNDFADVGYIIKEAGNQGAHPDEDPDLLDFTEQDAQDLQKIFMEIITDLFVVPETTKKVRGEFLERRKIK